MNRTLTRVAVSTVCTLVLAPTVLAQTKAPAAKEPAKAAQPSTSTKPAKEAKYPETPKKDLNAQRDFRGKKAPTFSVEKWLNRQPDQKNKTVLIDFWATWCPPCRKLVPELVAWHDKYKDDLVIIGISNETPAEVSKFILDQKVNYAMAIDTKKKMSRDIGIGGIPHVLVISSDGIVRWQGFPMGEDPLTEEKLVQIIEADKAARAAKAEAKKPKDKKDTKDKPADDSTKKPAVTPPTVKPVNPDEPKQIANPVKDK